jgi:DNA-binding LacI/PurR family transcriptional regulator
MSHLTIYEIAKKANVSIATISRAINPETRTKVKPETLETIDALVRKCGYTPNLAAKSLSKTRFQTVGVLFPQHAGIFLENYYVQVLAGISDALIDTAFHLRMVMLKCVESKYDQYNFKLGEGIDGLIVTHWHAFFRDKTSLEKLGIPVVVISDPERSVRVHFVSGDHVQGGRLAAEYLFGRGHRKIGLLTGPRDSMDGRLRVQGFSRFFKERGIEILPQHIASGDFQEEKARDAVQRLFARGRPDITAIFCCNDNMAYGAIRKLWELGFSCPKDISVVGYDDDKMAADFDPSLTTIHVPLYELAVQGSRQLVQFLDKKIAKKDFYTHALVPVQLVIRKSVRRLE